MRNRFGLFFLIATLCLVVLTITTVTFATSWAKLPPDQLIEEAQIVVEGRYIFSDSVSPPVNGMWVAFQFEADQYYKGLGNEVIVSAIEQFDVGWAKEFQDKGGKFILFLNQEKDLWIPVGGPNGMIQLLNGEIKNLSQEESNIITEFLTKQSPHVPTAQVQGINNTNIPNIRLVGLIFIGLLIVSYSLFYYKKVR